MKITKGALMVMKGQKVSTLYKLIGNIVVGRVAVTTPVKSSTDDTKLWHIRLSHIGERGMLELHKRNLLKGVKTCKLDFCKKSLIQLLKVERSGFIKHHRDMALKTWLALLS